MSVSWTYSKLNNFDSCPKKFWHLTVKKDVQEGESEFLAYGNRVHKAFEDRVKKGTKLPIDLARFEPMLARMVAKGTSPGSEIHSELKFALNDNFQPTGYFAKNVWVRVIIDLLIKKGPNALLVDYKTGKMKDDFLQVQICAAVMMCHDPEIQSITCAYYWTEEDEWTNEVLHRDDMMQLWNNIMPRVQKFQRAHERQEFPPKPSGLCKKHCPVQVCPYWGVGNQ